MSEGEQVSEGPLFARRSHSIFLTRNNTQSNGFLLPPSFPPSRRPCPAAGEEEAPLRSPTLWVPRPEWSHPDLSIAPHPRACAPRPIYQCVCMCVC